MPIDKKQEQSEQFFEQLTEWLCAQKTPRDEIAAVSLVLRAIAGNLKKLGWSGSELSKQLVADNICDARALEELTDGQIRLLYSSMIDFPLSLFNKYADSVYSNRTAIKRVGAKA